SAGPARVGIPSEVASGPRWPCDVLTTSPMREHRAFLQNTTLPSFTAAVVGVVVRRPVYRNDSRTVFAVTTSGQSLRCTAAAAASGPPATAGGHTESFRGRFVIGSSPPTSRQLEGVAMVKMDYWQLVVALSFALSLLAGCEQKGPMEKAGEKVDKAV